MTDDVKAKLDEIASNVKAAQELSETNKAASDAAAAKAADMMQEIQNLKQAAEGEKAAIEASLEELKKKFARDVKETGSSDALKSYSNQFNRYLKKGVAITDEVLVECTNDLAVKSFRGLTADEVAVEVKNLVAGSNPDGGYFIRPDISSKMVKRIFETSPMRSLADVITSNSDSVEMIIDDNELADGGWVGEVDARGDTGTPKIGKLIIEAHEIFAQPKATQKMLDDAGFDVEAWLQSKVVDRITRSENTAFVVGDGSQKPKGFLAYADAAAANTYERGKLGTLTTAGAGTIDGDDLINLQNLVKEAYQANATWAMNRTTFGAISRLKDSTGQYIFQTRFLNEMPNMVLLGKPVVFMDDMPVVATNALSVAYGDFRQSYTIVDRFGFRVLRDPYTLKPYIRFYTTKRTGGDVTSYDGLKRLRIQ